MISKELQYVINKCRDIPYNRKQYRVFACVFDSKNRVVSEGVNSYSRTHPRQFKAAKSVGLDEKCYLHAELAALIRDKQRKGVKLVVGRVRADGSPALAEPCPVCKAALREFDNIKSIEYSL